MYLARHGSFTRPRLIELQYRRIQRYRQALRDFSSDPGCSQANPPITFYKVRLWDLLAQALLADRARQLDLVAPGLF
jgi:hypothetical protein